MSNMQQIGMMFASFFRLYELPHPVLGISFGAILIGAFITAFAARILLPILGIGSKSKDGKSEKPKKEKDK